MQFDTIYNDLSEMGDDAFGIMFHEFQSQSIESWGSL